MSANPKEPDPAEITALIAEAGSTSKNRTANAEYVKGKNRIGEQIVFEHDADLFRRLADALESLSSTTKTDTE